MKQFGVSKEYLDKAKGVSKEQQLLDKQRFVTGTPKP
jgi:hypothetical protein